MCRETKLVWLELFATKPFSRINAWLPWACMVLFLTCKKNKKDNFLHADTYNIRLYMLYIIYHSLLILSCSTYLSGYSVDSAEAKWSILALCLWWTDCKHSPQLGQLLTPSHGYLLGLACPRFRCRSKQSLKYLWALINHYRYTSQAVIGTTAIYTHITRF
jgi:hypothetical protein